MPTRGTRAAVPGAVTAAAPAPSAGGRGPGRARQPVTAGREDATAPARWAARLLLALLLALPAGCGVGAQSREEPVSLEDALPAPPRPSVGEGGEQVVVYFVDGARLEPVPRSVPARQPQAALDQLLAGPTRAEVLSGLRTALSPQHLTVLTGPDGRGTLSVTVTRGFTSIGGGNQLLAVAQVVWTLTQFPAIGEVYFVLDGGQVAVPTDESLTDQPVDRADYTSVVPRPDEPTGPPPSPPPPASPTPTPPPSTTPSRPSSPAPSPVPPSAPSSPGTDP